MLIRRRIFWRDTAPMWRGKTFRQLIAAGETIGGLINKTIRDCRLPSEEYWSACPKNQFAWHLHERDSRDGSSGYTVWNTQTTFTKIGAPVVDQKTMETLDFNKKVLIPYLRDRLSKFEEVTPVTDPEQMFLDRMRTILNAITKDNTVAVCTNHESSVCAINTDGKDIRLYQTANKTDWSKLESALNPGTAYERMLPHLRVFADAGKAKSCIGSTELFSQLMKRREFF